MCSRNIAKKENEESDDRDRQMKRYNDKGERMTDCCGAASTYSMATVMVGGDLYDADHILSCKKCFREVSQGEGDGREKVIKDL
jgi:hypothetical protein